MADQYLTRQIGVGSSGPAQDLLQFSDGLSRINGVTIVNNSGLAVLLFMNQQGLPASILSPDVVIAPYSAQAISIASVVSIAVAYQGVNTNAVGQIYFHFTSSTIVSIASVLPPPPVTSPQNQISQSFSGPTPVVGSLLLPINTPTYREGTIGWKVTTGAGTAVSVSVNLTRFLTVLENIIPAQIYTAGALQTIFDEYAFGRNAPWGELMLSVSLSVTATFTAATTASGSILIQGVFR